MNPSRLRPGCFLILVTGIPAAACRSRTTAAVSEADSAAISRAVEASWRETMAGAGSLDPERVRAGYVDRPLVAVNGRIVEDYDRDAFPSIKSWLHSLRHLDASYDKVHVQVLSPNAAVATMMHHVKWTDSAGTPGEWNSAWTAVFRQVDGRWKIAYSHESTEPPAK